MSPLQATPAAEVGAGSHAAERALGGALLPQVHFHLPAGTSSAIGAYRSAGGEWLPVRFSRFDSEGRVLADGRYVVYRHGREATEMPPALFRLQVADGRVRVIESEGGSVLRLVKTPAVKTPMGEPDA